MSSDPPPPAVCVSPSSNLSAALRLYNTLSSLDPPQPHIASSLETLDAALRLYTPSNLCVAFNGGKDATTVLHLTLASFANYVHKHHPNPSPDSPPPRLNSLYLVPQARHDFPQMAAFVRETLTTNPLLTPSHIPLPIQQGIAAFVAARPAPVAFVMGTRRTDPSALTLHPFQPSSPHWPAFMRVNPILDWSYHHVWDFLRHFDIPFCPLYRNGYTSIGSLRNTLPNPHLAQSRNGSTVYKPAWLLSDPSQERAGRLSNTQTDKT